MTKFKIHETKSAEVIESIYYIFSLTNLQTKLIIIKLKINCIFSLKTFLSNSSKNVQNFIINVN